MIPDFIHGCIAPVFTAFNEDGTLDDTGQRNLLSFLRERGGISAYFIRSGMGQTYAFDYEDVKQIAKTACQHMKGDTLLIGTSGIWERDLDRRPDPKVYTRQAMDLAKFAEQQGAAGVVCTMPEALVPSDGETIADVVLRYFETVSTATTLPVLIYQPPGTAKEYHVTVDLIRKLADLPAIKGMKVSTTDAEYILDLTWAVAGKDFGYIVGAETAFYAGLCSGARAVIGQGAAINPQILNAVQDRLDAGDSEGAVEAQRAANLLVQEAVETVTFFKRYATENGYPIKPCRRATAREGYSTEAPKILTDAQYDRYKHLLESELAKYR